MKKFDTFPLCLLALVCWVYLISALSGQAGPESTHQSQYFCDGVHCVLGFLGLILPEQLCGMLQFLVRKTAHMTEYCILAVLLTLCLKRVLPFGKSLVWALVLGVAVACADEFHQYFIPGRDCKVTDVLIDTTGFVAGLVFCLLVRTLLARRSRRVCGSSPVRERSLRGAAAPASQAFARTPKDSRASRDVRTSSARPVFSGSPSEHLCCPGSTDTGCQSGLVRAEQG